MSYRSDDTGVQTPRFPYPDGVTTWPSSEVRPHRLKPPLLRAEDIERQRLTRLILATPPSGTCIISAPPGYGATTAVGHALTDAGGVAWVSLDAYDRTPSHFWNQLGAAVTPEASASGPPIPHLEDEADLLARMPAFIEWLSHSTCSWIVLDDVTTETHGAWQSALAYLIANLPPPIRMVVTTHDAARRMPLDLTDHRVTIIERELLRADFDEATAILLGTVPDLDIDTIEEVADAAQGWVAGIGAAARRAVQYPAENTGHWLTTHGARALVDPWLDQLPPDRLAFLSDTCFLEQLSGPLCDIVLDRSDSIELLEALETRGGYLAALPPSEDGVRWWGRHPLLTAGLNQRITSGGDAEQNHRAAAWFQARGDFEATMRHLLATGRVDEAGAHLRAHENALFEAGKGDRAAAWYASLPPESWGQLGWHLVRVGWGQVFGTEPQAADASLAQLRAHLASSPSEGGEHRVLQAETATLAAYIADKSGDTSVVLANARRAMDLFSDASPGNSQQIAPLLVIKALLREGDVEGARREITRIRFQAFPTAIIREVSLGALKSQCLTDEGNITLARRELRRAQRWVDAQGLAPADVAQFSLLTADGAATLESGDCASALEKLQIAGDAALSKRAIGEAAVASIWQARARIALGELGGALECTHEARRLLQESAPSSPILHRVDLMEAFIRHIGGDAVRAERLVQRVPPSDTRTLMWARVTVHRQANAVRRSVATIESGMPRIAIDKQVVLAMVAMKRGNALAEGHLTRAAELAGASGFALALLGCPPDLLSLAESLALRTSHDSLSQLVRQAQHAKVISETNSSSSAQGLPLARPQLSPGELQLITFLPGRDSNAEIAKQLGVSVNTVKTRLYRLYRKLGVDSRDDAINAARARGLIS